MNIGINIQEKMKKISKQAKETFDYAKMELKIKTYGRECKKRYSKIGSLVYECRKKGSAVNGEEIENLCREIDKYKHRIKVIQRQIDELKADDVQDNPEVVEDYTLEKKEKESLYEQLYRFIREDILSGRLQTGERLPSKRMLAQHLEVSIITVKNAYEQLLAEGYLYARQRSGYFVAPVERPPQPRQSALFGCPNVTADGTFTSPNFTGNGTDFTAESRPWLLDFASGAMDPAYFPFTVWARLMRQTILEQDKELLRAAPYNGAAELRVAIAGYLRQFRAMQVDPEQIIIGAGTELLYNLLIQLLGRDKCYAVEEPGYSKITAIYESNQVRIQRIGIDNAGLSVPELRRGDAQVVHISPTHHYPTGAVMPIGRRRELLRWAAEQPERYILEDDYDSEFRFVGRPIPTLYSTDENQCVVYLNTFSKTIAPSIRISYMILPPRLLERYRDKLGFYACTVSGFEQYTLAKFLQQGHFERHLGRMRTRYRQKRDRVISDFLQGPLAGRVQITGQDTGLHFLAELQTALPDEELQRRASEAGLRLAMLSDYYRQRSIARRHTLVVNYSGLDLQHLPQALQILADILEEESPCTTN